MMYCPWNEGRWRVASDGVERGDGAVGVAAASSVKLGSAYLGGVTWNEFRVCGLCRGGRRTARPTARSALFAAERAPWCP